jgi:hypothetical protein
MLPLLFPLTWLARYDVETPSIESRLRDGPQRLHESQGVTMEVAPLLALIDCGRPTCGATLIDLGGAPPSE